MAVDAPLISEPGLETIPEAEYAGAGSAVTGDIPTAGGAVHVDVPAGVPPAVPGGAPGGARRRRGRASAAPIPVTAADVGVAHTTRSGNPLEVHVTAPSSHAAMQDEMDRRAAVLQSAKSVAVNADGSKITEVKAARPRGVDTRPDPETVARRRAAYLSANSGWYLCNMGNKELRTQHDYPTVRPLSFHRDKAKAIERMASLMANPHMKHVVALWPANEPVPIMYSEARVADPVKPWAKRDAVIAAYNAYNAMRDAEHADRVTNVKHGATQKSTYHHTKAAIEREALKQQAAKTAAAATTTTTTADTKTEAGAEETKGDDVVPTAASQESDEHTKPTKRSKGRKGKGAKGAKGAKGGVASAFMQSRPHELQRAAGAAGDGDGNEDGDDGDDGDTKTAPPKITPGPGVVALPSVPARWYADPMVTGASVKDDKHRVHRTCRSKGGGFINISIIEDLAPEDPTCPEATGKEPCIVLWGPQFETEAAAKRANEEELGGWVLDIPIDTVEQDTFLHPTMVDPDKIKTKHRAATDKDTEELQIIMDSRAVQVERAAAARADAIARGIALPETQVNASGVLREEDLTQAARELLVPDAAHAAQVMQGGMYLRHPVVQLDKEGNIIAGGEDGGEEAPIITSAPQPMLPGYLPEGEVPVETTTLSDGTIMTSAPRPELE